MHDAAVGHQCAECVEAGSVRRPRARARGSSLPVVTYALIVVNVAAFVAETTSKDVERRFVLWPPAVAHGQFDRLVTSAFLHYGLTHLLFNMVALYFVGPPLEMWLGRARFGALYALSGLGGSVLAYLLSPLDAATAGASGAIFGLFGAMFVVGRRLSLDVRGVAWVIVFNLVFTFVFPVISGQQISWQAHLGGLVTGALVAAAYVYPPEARRTAVGVAATIAVLAVFAVLVGWRTAGLLAELAL
jgi:membrane associated rhomboid family serine protease